MRIYHREAAVCHHLLHVISRCVSMPVHDCLERRLALPALYQQADCLASQRVLLINSEMDD